MSGTDSQLPFNDESLAGKVILLVDDDPVLKELGKRSMHRLGYKVLEAEDGNSALAVLAQHHVDLVYSDTNMPGMDGVGLLKALREPDSRFVHLPFILTSGFDYREQALTLGATDFIKKGDEPDELSGKIANALKGNSEPVKALSKKVILLVDDFPAIRNGMKMYIEDQNAGYEVVTAVNGMDALKVLKSRHVDMVISDTNMPVMDGMQLLKLIREAGEAGFKHIPFILMSTNDYSMQAKAFGANAFMNKDRDFFEGGMDKIAELLAAADAAKQPAPTAAAPSSKPA